MAVIHQGALTSGIRGKVGDLIFQMVNGIQIVRQMPPSIQDPNTPLQQIQRAAFTQAVQEWRDLNVEERALWDFGASLRGSKTRHQRARRVDHTPKPTNNEQFDGHNWVIAQKSREADYNRNHGDDTPAPIDLQDPPPFAKTKNVPPAHLQILLVIGSEGSAWNPEPFVNYDGLWWTFSEVTERTTDSKARAWVQPPYPIHSQRITIEDSEVVFPWSLIEGVLPGDGFMWAWKMHVKAVSIRVVRPKDAVGPWEVTNPYVWKSQLDFLDANFQDTKGSAVIRFYLPLGLIQGIFQVWPAPLVDLTPAP